MKKIILILTCILFLTSCSSKEIKGYTDLLRSPQKVSNEKFEKLISAIETQNENELRNLFSKTVVDESENFSESASALFDFYRGEMKTYKYWSATASSRKKRTGERWRTVDASYDVETTEGAFCFAFKTVTIDNTNSDNLGISSLYIIDYENSDKGFAYWGDGEWTPGINIVTEKQGD